MPLISKKNKFIFGERERFMLLLMAPAAILLILFQIIPIAIGLNVSFRDWALYNPKETWVGLKHYLAIFSDPIFTNTVLPNTFIFMAGSVSFSLIIGMCIALLLNRKVKGQKIIQTVLLLPLMVAPVIAAIMMRWMFNDQFGIVNVVLGALGLETVSWFTNRVLAFSVILFTDIWLWTPWFTILLLAALQSFPKEPFEAAEIDGTSRWRTFWYITLPMLRPVIVVCVVIRTIDAFRTFDIVWTLTGGGPGRGTEIFSLYAYVIAFQNLNFGKGSAAAMIGAVIILAFGLVLYKVLNKVVDTKA
jgi:multiple sugar transport system permease protein